ncbi:MAG: universal stress protein [Actinomycetota bacterium]
MTVKILACIDDSPSARPVLDTARALARVLKADVEALHVRENGTMAVQRDAQAVDVPLHVELGDPISMIAGALREDQVLLGVLGTRRDAVGWRPAGHVALAVAEGASKPLVVVPPDFPSRAPEEVRRLLVPLDGTPEAATAVRSSVHVFAGSGVEVVALHVFDREHAPRFMDRPEHDLEVWAEEFLARYCAEPGARVEIRRGEAGEQVVEVAESARVDMIALGWSQDLSPGHAAVVRDVLTRACVPIMLVPIAAAPVETERIAAEAT